MILFEREIEEKGAYIHTKTSNMSFLRMYAILKKMGISNNKFFLTTYDKELLTIDVHKNTDPSQELAARIVRECKLNPWYYLREVILIPGAGEDIRYELNRGNLALTWSYLSNIDVYLVMARQCGKSMSTHAIVSWVIFLVAEKFNMAMFTKDIILLQENVKRVRDIRNALPKYLIHRDKLKDTENKTGLAYAALNTQYLTFVAQPEVMAAAKLARGMSISSEHWDEFEYFKNIDLSYPSAVAAMGAAAEQAKALGLPHTNIITSTAGKLNSPETQYALKLISQAMPFSETLYDCRDKQHLHEVVSTNSTNKMLYAVFSYLQLDKSHAWFKETTVKTGGTPEEIARDYLNLRQAGIEGSIIPALTLDKIKKSQEEPTKTTIMGGYAFRWYQDPELLLNNKLYKRPLIMGLDTSENIGQDFTTLVIIDATDLSVVGTAKCNEADLIKFATFLGEFMAKHDHLFLVPERKSTALIMLGIICAILRKAGTNPWTRIFNQVFQNRTSEPYCKIDVTDSSAETGANKKYLGYVTAGSGEMSRNTLYKVTLMKTLELNATRIKDQSLIDELCQLTLKNDRIDHSAGGHDDMVIAYLLACWFVLYGKNINLYRLNRNDFLSGVTNTGDKIDPTEKKALEEIRARIEEVKQMLRNTKFPAVRSSLIRELTHLESLLGEEAENASDAVVREEDISGKMQTMDPSVMISAIRAMYL